MTGLGRSLTWSLCIPTLNRVDVLLRTIEFALAQTRPPLEVVVVDASDDWEVAKARAEALVAGRGVTLRYLPAPKRSSAVQRNAAIETATGDILFLFDDDTFMYPDCAEILLETYEADTEERVAGLTPGDASGPPEAGRGADIGPAKSDLDRGKVTMLRRMKDSALLRWIWREILMMSTDRLFVPYDGTWHGLDGVDPTGLMPTRTILGYRVTVRRAVCLTEPFDPHLLAYAPCEDTDATYRYSRHGTLLQNPQARVFHFESASSRLRRRNVATLFVLNNAYFIRRNSNDFARDRRIFTGFVYRRVLAEALKDLLTRRFSLPQCRGVLAALPLMRRIFAHPREGLGEWYETVQAQVLAR